MKKFTKLLLVSVLAISCLFVGGCSLFAKEPTAEELLSSGWGVEDANYVDVTMTMDVAADVDMSDQGLGIDSMSMEMSFDIDMEMDTESKTAYMYGDASIDVFGMTVSEDIKAYSVYTDDSLCTYTFDADKDCWVFEEDETQDLEDFSEKLQFKAEDFKSISMKEVEKDDTEYIIECVMSLEDASNFTGNEDLNFEGQELGLDGDMNVTIIYDRETKVLKTIEMELDEDSLPRDEGTTFSKFNITLEFNEIGDGVVEVPKKVIKEAVDEDDLDSLGSSGDDIDTVEDDTPTVVYTEPIDEFIDDTDIKEDDEEYEKPSKESDGVNQTQSSEWVNFDNMQFFINGKCYTLGKTTLQELIDDGVPFESDALANAGNNVNPDYSSDMFTVELGEYQSAYISVVNYTDSNMRACDLPITRISCSVYQNASQDVLKFNFPFNITEKDLVSVAGEPTEYDEFVSDDGSYFCHYYDYINMNGSDYLRYSFEFDNDGLCYVALEG